LILSSQIKGIDLLDVVLSSGVEMRKSGTRHVGRCPLHHEKTPSFFIFSNNRFRCFGCGAHGDAVDFVSKLHGLCFLDACAFLGIEKTNPTPEMLKTIRRQQKKREDKKAFQKWLEAKIDEYALLYRCADRVLYGIKTPEDLDRRGALYHARLVWEQKYKLYLEADKSILWEMFKRENAI